MLAEVNLLVSREQTATHKPDPAPYLHALNELAAQPEHAIAFEDSRDGLKAAMGAGLYTFYLGDKGGAAGSYEAIRSLSELL